MNQLEKQPEISIGILEKTGKINFSLNGQYLLNTKELPAERYEAWTENNLIHLKNSSKKLIAAFPKLQLVPKNPQTCFITISDIPIGKSFHWHRLQEHSFRSELVFTSSTPATITLVNQIPIEWYLESVICSEMNSRCPLEFLKAHSIISRSWTLAQLSKKKTSENSTDPDCRSWTDASVHKYYDLCADDHCQRYHGTGSINPAVQKTIMDTSGEVLIFGNEICDTRFSKCCGGITEKFSTCWQDLDIPYLQSVTDHADSESSILPHITDEQAAKNFILSEPESFCNIENNPEILGYILPGFDLETHNFFRWEFSVLKKRLGEILYEKSGIDFGEIKKIISLARGPSGRIYKLKISGTKNEGIFGKELEIRRILSPTHLYSSAFIIEDRGDNFMFFGAGWGHGVGLCQIGAACMALKGYDYKQILLHYFRGAHLEKIY